MLKHAAIRGLVAGVAGVAAMTAAEKVEQLFTHRPNSYVPAHTLERLLQLTHKSDEAQLELNWAMHWGQGIVLGAVRGLMAERGLRGPVGSFLFMTCACSTTRRWRTPSASARRPGLGRSTSR